ncbi:hypothetical protein [Aeromicrobium sp. 9AM]|uniref:hypothetical protein n=1 Tax=Aeromicrobium sp. 9AM TaxID=2653126 RepID=UPI0012F2F48A|nr:hypothetical protein [Aeromicrobium sp. 9AM]VXC54343.1 conserved hypothetical protein [Aeromicrobium sp. 9AM]
MKPLWTDPSPMAVGVWDTRAESSTQLAVRLKRALDGIDQLGAGGTWVTPDGEPIDPSVDLEPFVAAHMSRDDHGDPVPEDGYSMSVSKQGRLGVGLTVKAGRGVPGRRVPANRFTLFLTGGPRHDDIVALFRVFTEAWSPTSASVRDERATMASKGRGAWAPFVGQVTWVGSELGSPVAAVDGVEFIKASGGTLIVASPRLDPEQAVAAALEVLDRNGISTTRPDQ